MKKGREAGRDGGREGGKKEGGKEVAFLFLHSMLHLDTLQTYAFHVLAEFLETDKIKTLSIQTFILWESKYKPLELYTPYWYVNRIGKSYIFLHKNSGYQPFRCENITQKIPVHLFYFESFLCSWKRQVTIIHLMNFALTNKTYLAVGSPHLCFYLSVVQSLTTFMLTFVTRIKAGPHNRTEIHRHFIQYRFTFI